MRPYLFLFFYLHFSQASQSYKGYKVLRTQTLTADIAKTVNDILDMSDIASSVDVWKEAIPGRKADIMSPPTVLEKLSTLLNDRGVNYTVMVDDVEKVIEDDKPNPLFKFRFWRNRRYAMTWADYHDFHTINEFLDALAAQVPWAIVLPIGTSYEGRSMNVLAVTKAGPGKPNIFIESGVHAREWIAPAVATFIARELVEHYASHPEYVDQFNWYILPSANPDGYQYSRDTDRLWRKTTSRNAAGRCRGVDMNRNFAFHYGESGTSSNPCSNSYRGPHAFSEVESKYIRDFVRWLSPTPVLATCLHSYGQDWLWPYGYARHAYPDNWVELEAMAVTAARAIEKVHGTSFRPINSADLYPAAGDSCDWYKGEVGVRFVFTPEMRDTGRHGFMLPREQIVPAGEEMWAAFRAMLDEIL